MEKYQAIFIQIPQKLAKITSQKDLLVKDIKAMFEEKKKSFFARIFKKK